MKKGNEYKTVLSELAKHGIEHREGIKTYSNLRHTVKCAKEDIRMAKLGAGYAEKTKGMFEWNREKYSLLAADPFRNSEMLLAKGDRLVRTAKDALRIANNKRVAIEDLEIAVNHYLAAVYRNPSGAGRRVANYIFSIKDENTRIDSLRYVGYRIRLVLETAQKLEKSK